MKSITMKIVIMNIIIMKIIIMNIMIMTIFRYGEYFGFSVSHTTRSFAAIKLGKRYGVTHNPDVTWETNLYCSVFSSMASITGQATVI